METIPVNLTNKYRWQCKPMLLLSLCKIFSCMTLRPHMQKERKWPEKLLEIFVATEQRAVHVYVVILVLFLLKN